MHRRRLGILAGWAAVLVCFGPTVGGGEPVAGEAATAPGHASRVRLSLDVEGELFAPVGGNAPPLRQPITVTGRYDFLEAPVAESRGTVVRRYLDAAADVRVEGVARRITLGDDARVLSVGLRGTTPSPWLATGFLSRDELDLVQTPFDPLLVDAIAPAEPIEVGGAWNVPGDVIAGLLAIDTVESGELRATLAKVTLGRATVTFAGIVDGAIDGVPTHVNVEGSLTLPGASTATAAYRLAGPVESLTATIRERREAGYVAPGFDVEARLALARSATEDRVAVAEAPAAGSRRRGPGRQSLLWHRDADGRFDLVHDECWRTVEDGADGLVMRMVDHGTLVAQCSITALPRTDARTPPTIAEVERDLERSLAGQFGRIEHAAEATRSDGVRIVRVAVAGQADDLPFRWIHHVLTDAAGHRLAVTCMLQTSLEGRFGAADRELVDGIVLPGDGAEPASATAEADGADGEREARLPKDSRTP